MNDSREGRASVVPLEAKLITWGNWGLSKIGDCSNQLTIASKRQSQKWPLCAAQLHRHACSLYSTVSESRDLHFLVFVNLAWRLMHVLSNVGWLIRFQGRGGWALSLPPRHFTFEKEKRSNDRCCHCGLILTLSSRRVCPEDALIWFHLRDKIRTKQNAGSERLGNVSVTLRWSPVLSLDSGQ